MTSVMSDPTTGLNSRDYYSLRERGGRHDDDHDHQRGGNERGSCNGMMMGDSDDGSAGTAIVGDAAVADCGCGQRTKMFRTAEAELQ